MDAIATLFERQGFNCIRVPFSVWMVHTDRAVYNDTLLHANPSLKGKAQLEILDAVVDACASAGLMIVLDNHMSDGDCPSTHSIGGAVYYADRGVQILICTAPAFLFVCSYRVLFNER